MNPHHGFLEADLHALRATTGAQAVRSFAQPGLVDTSGTCDAYQRLIDLLHAGAGPALDAALAASAQAHQRETRPSTGRETFDFDAQHDALIPMERLCYLRVRHWLGHTTPWPAQLPCQPPPGALAPQAAAIEDGCAAAACAAARAGGAAGA